jgi:hypothetical protein
LNRRQSNRTKVRRLASASRKVRRTTMARRVSSPRYTRAVQRSAPPTRGARRPGSGSSTRAGKPKMATPATSSTPGGWATRRHTQRRATTLDGVGATTAGRTARRRRSHREPVCSAGRSARRASPSAFASLLTVYFGAPSMFITLWFGFDYGTNLPLGTLII